MRGLFLARSPIHARYFPIMNTPNDPFAEARRKSGVLRCPFQGESIPMILRHADVLARGDLETHAPHHRIVPVVAERHVLERDRRRPIFGQVLEELFAELTEDL